MDDSCAVCAETLEWVAFGGCAHKDVCSTCVARLRFICNDHRCCICKTDSPVVFVTKALGDYTRTIGDFSQLPSEPKEGRVGQYWYHEGTQAFFDDLDQYKMIKAMCKLSCSVCDKIEGLPDDVSKRRAKFRNIEQLKGHLFHKHRLYMCSLCLEGRKVFICEQKLYARSQLAQHIETGDSEVDGSESERGGFTGHPMCEFCRTPFYGDNELYMHMSTEHYTCHICQRRHPGQYEYYKNYDDLEIHFHRDHFLCEDEGCLAKKFTVFQSEAELKRHNALEHGGRMSRSKHNAALQIPTSFRYRRTNEQESRRGRGRTFRRDPTDGELALAIQASLETASAASYGAPAITDHEEATDSNSLIPPLGSTDSTDSEPPSRYLHALSVSSRSGTLGESSFPPLPVASGSNQPNSNLDAVQKETMAAHLRRKSNRKANSSGSAPAWSAATPAPTHPVISPQSWPAISSVSRPSTSSGQSRLVAEGLHTTSSNLASAQARPSVVGNPSFAGSLMSSRASASSSCISHSSSAPNLSVHESGEPSNTDFPPVLAAQVRRPQNADRTLGKVEDVHTANKSLVEKMRIALGFDEDKYNAFKGISGEYRQGSMDAETYLSYVEQFGLSHLVLEMAKLLPNVQKQKELIEVYNVHMAYTSSREKKGSEGSRKGKGKLEGFGKDIVKSNLSDNVISTVRELLSSYRGSEDDEVLTKDGYRSSKGKSKHESSRPTESTKLKSQSELSSASGGDTIQKSGNSDGKSKQRKKTSKFHRVRLGDGGAEAFVDVKDNEAEAEAREGGLSDNGSLPNSRRSPRPSGQIVAYLNSSNGSQNVQDIDLVEMGQADMFASLASSGVDCCQAPFCFIKIVIRSMVAIVDLEGTTNCSAGFVAFSAIHVIAMFIKFMWPITTSIVSRYMSHITYHIIPKCSLQCNWS